MSAELKPCPFCGGIAQGWRDVSRPEQKEAGYGALQYGVKCASDLVCEAEIVGFATREEADAAWNTRAPQWQPIESAPKDGRPIQLHSPRWNMPVAQGGWDAHEMAWIVKGHGCPSAQPTHWQPLPAPPEVKS